MDANVVIKQVLADNRQVHSLCPREGRKEAIAKLGTQIGMAARLRLIRREPVLRKGVQKTETAGKPRVLVKQACACPHRRNARYIAARLKLSPHHIELAGHARPCRV